MKKLTFISIALVVSIFVSCKQKETDNNNNHSDMMNDSTMMQNDSTMMNNDSTMMNNDSKMMDNDKKMMSHNMYSCPMHPEVTGEKGEKCSKCGMELKLTDSKK